MRRRRNLGIHFCIFCEEELCFIEFALIISAVGRAFLRPREDWRRVGERFPRGVTLTDDCWTPRMLQTSRRLVPVLKTSNFSAGEKRSS